MSLNIDQEIAEIRKELKDLEEAIARRDLPLGPIARRMAEAKIAKIRDQIALIERGKHVPSK